MSHDHRLPPTLSKSRFKQALECPRKLVYTSDARYVNENSEDDFLEALARGGHQVGALAKLIYPGGIEVRAPRIEDQVAETAALLSRENVTIFEATIQHGVLLVRVDVLVKRGIEIDLIEVKSKSFNAITESFSGKRGGILSEWRPYLYDVAYQQLVLERAHPEWTVRPFLMLVDPIAVVPIDGLGTALAVRREGRQVIVEVDPSLSIQDLVPPVLRAHDVRPEVAALRTRPVESPAGAQPFEAFVDGLAAAIAAQRVLPPSIGKQCKHCEFYCDPDEVSPERRSGWAECIAGQYHRPAATRRTETVLALYNHRGIEKILGPEQFLLAELEEDDVDPQIERGQISGSHRHWLQVQEARRELIDRFVEADALRGEFASWRWPLHFIDFETSRPVLPSHRGNRPNQQLVFQFSHHVLDAAGRLEHRTQRLVAEPGVPPNAAIIRALRDAIGGDDGSVAHWWDHERTVLDDVARQLAAGEEPDRDGLVAFIDALTGDAARLQDLGRLVSRTAFFAGTRGSSSIKKVLPVVLRQSTRLRERYGLPVYGTAAMPSLNFSGFTWYRERNGEVIDPYELLDPLFEDAELQRAIAQEEAQNDYVADGAGAIIAYADLQRRDLPADERDRLRRQLLRYCELDTLAMVMIYEALREWIA